MQKTLLSQNALQSLPHCKFQVLPDGQYVTRGSEKINYLTMIVIRVGILRGEVVLTLMKACTIAIRYSVVRRQSELKPGDPEAKILDYQTQQQKLLPQLATAYAFHFVCDYMQDVFNQGYADTKEGKFDLLPEKQVPLSSAALTPCCLCFKKSGFAVFKGGHYCCRGQNNFGSNPVHSANKLDSPVLARTIPTPAPEEL
ncbi:Peroxisomal acyl-coenzyme A oxidase 2 [Varanus komodoensis]|nr:Peroxisomal acyl-coenzyme A oxidase 2 [Varanus komodoensis]